MPKFLERKQVKFLHYIGFIILPFLSLIFALKNYRKSWSKNIAWWFIAYFGFTLVIVNQGIDAVNYKNDFLEMASKGYSLQNLFRTLYSPANGGELDIYQPLISYFVSLFTDNYHIFFAVIGLVFGYFYSRNIWFLLERLSGKMKWRTVLLLIIFAFTVGFWRIQSVRFWTATQMFAFGILPLLYEDKKKNLWVCFLTPLVHFAYFIPLFILFLYKLLKNRTKLYYWVFVVGLLISSLNMQQIQSTAKSVLPSFLNTKIESYMNQDRVQEIAQRSQEISTINVIYRFSFDFFILCFVSILVFRCKDALRDNFGLFKLFNFSLLLLAAANILSNIPDGGRFVDLARLLIIACFILSIQNKAIYQKQVKYLRLFTPILVLLCIAPLRRGFNYIGVMTLFGNPFYFIFDRIDIAINEILGLI